MTATKLSWNNIAVYTAIVVSIALHWQYLPKGLMEMHVWRQTQTQSNIVNFYEEDMNVLNPRRNDRGHVYQTFRVEFPFMQWLVALVYHITGPDVLVTRLCMMIIGIGSILGVYAFLHSLFRKDLLAALGTWAFTFSPTFYFYFINPLPDNLALCSGIWGLTLFVNWTRSPRRWTYVSSGLLLAIAGLCKLPFILFFAVPITYIFFSFLQQKNYKRFVSLAAGYLLFISLPVAWFILALPEWGGNHLMKGVFYGPFDPETYLTYLRHHLHFVFPRMLINETAFPFFIIGLIFLVSRRAYRHEIFPALLAGFCAVLAYFFYELNMIALVHDYYLFPFFPFLYALVGYGVYHVWGMKSRVVNAIIIILLLAMPYHAWHLNRNGWNPDDPGFNKDLLLHKEALRKATPKQDLVVAGNDYSHYIMMYYIDRKGWAFDSDVMDSVRLAGAIQLGAKYLYSDSRVVDENEVNARMIDSLVLEAGSIRVFRLKAPEDLSQ